MNTNYKWWQGIVIYQIYPRSFFDSSGNGIGDLRGVIDKLDYVASLGVDAIWLSPFFASPMKDFGYDVSDYREVDPLFGTVQDFKELITKAHKLNLKILIDQVMNHTSDQHEWFKESKSSRDNSKADWYVWVDPQPDGSPPNNWLSIFGGSAWKWNAKRHQYYLHNFLESQPDLNFHCPEVRIQILEETKFWLELGVDGLRLDVVNFYFHDKNLRSNPALDRTKSRNVNAPMDNPYTYQRHLYDVTQPENIPFLKEIRNLLDEFGATSVGEIGDDHPLQTMANYTSGQDKLHMAYTFDLLTDRADIPYIKNVIKNLNEQIGDGWPCWALSNHDSVRAVTRWGKGQESSKVAPAYLALLLTLKGSACIYQGEELGLPEADVPFEKIQDPYGIPFWPEYKGRDGCRTPIPWEAKQTNFGFSVNEPWLPIPREHSAYACSSQEFSDTSILNRYRKFIHWRKEQPTLINGEMKILESCEQSIVFLRTTKEQAILVALNLTAEILVCEIAENYELEELVGHGFNGAKSQNSCVILPPFEAFFARVQGY